MQFIIKKFLIIYFFITLLCFKTICIQIHTENIEDFGLISLMYHRFEENKYPSTNIKYMILKNI